MTWAEHLIHFYRRLQPPAGIPKDVEVLHPQKDPQVMGLVEQFAFKFFNDNQHRRLIIGINPGRFGAGITGVNFTGPKQLKEYLGIDHPFKLSSELSAEFIYRMIDRYGGPEKFYREYFITAASPLGFVKGGKNINYYDDKELLQSIRPFIIKTLEKQLTFGVEPTKAFCIGEDKNFKLLKGLNDDKQWFDTITPLPHPRFIMQYKRKRLDEYVDKYIVSLRG